MKFIQLIALIILFNFGFSNLYSREKGSYSTDIFGAKVYKDGNYEESISLDIFGNKQFKNNLGESASLKKDIFNDMIYTDNRNNEVKIDEVVWRSMLEDVHGDIDALFYDLITQNTSRNNSKVSIEIDIMGREIYKENNLTEEFWVDILGTQQYRNSNGESASIRKDILDCMNYTDSKGNNLSFSADTWQRMFRHTGGRERSVFRSLINQYLFFR